MIKSMTGYGRAEFANDDLKITVEIKSVNNRYLDIGIKMPRQLGMLESSIRAELKKYIKRGKVDVYIAYEDLKEANVEVKYNSKIAGEYLGYLRQMAQEYGITDDIRVSNLAKFPDVFTMEEEPLNPDKLWESLRSVITEAAENFLQSRVREGETTLLASSTRCRDMWTLSQSGPRGSWPPTGSVSMTRSENWSRTPRSRTAGSCRK